MERSNFQSTHQKYPLISTPEQDTKIKEIMCTYIHTYTQNRKKEKGKRTDRKNIVVYDLDYWESLEELARREGTTLSAILNNLYEHFIQTIESPQKAIDSFAYQKVIPTVDSSPETWRNFYKDMTKEEYKEFDAKVQTMLAQHDRKWRELN